MPTQFQLTEQRYTLRYSDGTPEPSTISIAFVQWANGYDPATRPLSEWTTTPININWAGTYQPIVGQVGPTGHFYALPSTFTFDSPVYLFAQLSNAEAWMGQISDVLVLDGTTQTFKMDAANIRAVVGTFDGKHMTAMNPANWQPTAIPEPSTYGLVLGVAFLAVALLRRQRS